MSKTLKGAKAEGAKSGKAKVKSAKESAELTGAAAMTEARRRHGFEPAPTDQLEQRTIFVDVHEYSPTIPAGPVTGNSVADHAEGHPYLALAVSGGGDLGAGSAELERVYFIFADAIAGQVETARRDGRYEIYAGAPAIHFAAAHHMVQSEKPLKMRVRLQSSSGDVTFQEADLYAPSQRIGQRER